MHLDDFGSVDDLDRQALGVVRPQQRAQPGGGTDQNDLDAERRRRPHRPRDHFVGGMVPAHGVDGYAHAHAPWLLCPPGVLVTGLLLSRLALDHRPAGIVAARRADPVRHGRIVTLRTLHERDRGGPPLAAFPPDPCPGMTSFLNPHVLLLLVALDGGASAGCRAEAA